MSGLADGQMATAAHDFHCCVVRTFANQDIIPAYARAAPGLVNGIVRINFQVTNTGGFYSVAINGRRSNLFAVSVT